MDFYTVVFGWKIWILDGEVVLINRKRISVRVFSQAYTSFIKPIKIKAIFKLKVSEIHV